MKDYLLEQEEWNFTNIPEDELESAWLYELARTAGQCVMNKELIPKFPVGDDHRVLDWDRDEDRKYWYESTIGWYDEWSDCHEIWCSQKLPWVKLSAEYKTRYMLIHRDQIPAHLTHDPDLNLPYSKSLVHLEYNPEPNSEILQKRHKVIKGQQRPVTSLQLFELNCRQGIDSKSEMVEEFRKFLDKEFPHLPTKSGRPKNKMPELTDLGIFRLLKSYTPEETKLKIRGAYSQRSRTSLKEVIKAEQAVYGYIKSFCQPYKPTFTTR